jgi:8-oxo-dGTP diphosphatase
MEGKTTMSQLPNTVHTVAGVIRRSNEILLVRQQGLHDPVATWALPGGVVEPHELPTDALAREVREETGLVVADPIRLIYIRWGADPSGRSRGMTLVFDVSHRHGELQPADPHGLVDNARFFAVPEAIEKLRQLPWEMMREPILAHLAGRATPGTLWLYHQYPEGAVRLAGVVTT